MASVQDALRLNGRRSFGLQLLLARAYVATGRYSSAERLLNQLVTQQPTSVPPLTMLAELFLSQGRLKSADLVLARAARIDNSHPRLRELLARRGGS
jgi:predicted Zn-dependent protease